MVPFERMDLMKSLFSFLLPFLLLTGCGSTVKKANELGYRHTQSFESPEFAKLGLRFPLVERRLSNGLKILIVEDHTVPVVAFQTWVNVGSVDENFGLSGMAHLFEHLMFKDSDKYGPRAFFNRLEAKGAAVNAFTTRDYTVFYETMVPALLPVAIALESDRLANLKIDEEALYTERRVVFEERRLRTENSPDGRMQEAIWSLVFKSHPYRAPVIGYEEDLKRMELADLQAFFEEYYQPKNITLVVVGDVKVDEVFAQIETAYGPIPGKTRERRRISSEPEQTEARRFELRDQVATEKITIAYPSTSASEDDTHALDVLSNILFVGTTARTYRRAVEEKGMAHSIGGVNYTPLYPGLFMASATLKSGHSAGEFENEFESLVKDIQATGVTDKEIKNAVRQLTVQTVDSVRTGQGLANLIGTVDAIFGDPMRFKEDLAKYSRVTNADVIRVSRKYLTPIRKNVITLVPNGLGKAK